MYSIDSLLLTEALVHYASIGYVPIKAPAVVDKDIVDLTLPSDRKSKPHLDKHYVGSAEQSFYQLLKEGLNPVGSYLLITPCQRYDEPSPFHLQIFLKVELISVEKYREEILEDVLLFYGDQRINTEVVDTLTGYDINVNGIEVGSFGDRLLNGRWITHGTGLALPRISYAIEQGF